MQHEQLLCLEEAEHFPDIWFPAFSSVLGGLWGLLQELLAALSSAGSLVPRLGSTRGSRRCLVAFLALAGVDMLL